METKIVYVRDGKEHSVTIETRLVPNPLAVRFVVIEHELGKHRDLVAQEEPVFLDDLLSQMGIRIISTFRTGETKSAEATQPK